MRPTANRQSALRMPLNEILGTEANVRVLRVLAERSAPITAAEIARQTQLQRSTVSRTLKHLDIHGVIDFTGIAPQAQASLRSRGTLGKALRQLFLAERNRFDAILAGLRDVAQKLATPMSIWIGPSIGLGLDRAGDPIPVFLLDSSDKVALVAQVLRDSLGRLERQFDVTFDVREVTLADFGTSIDASDMEGTTLVAGIPPLSLHDNVRKNTRASRKRLTSHAEHDAAAVERARRVADAIKRDPEMIQRAKAYIEKRRKVASPGERRELDEWRSILRNASPASIRKLLTDRGERATRLRQTMPFLTRSGSP